MVTFNMWGNGKFEPTIKIKRKLNNFFLKNSNELLIAYVYYLYEDFIKYPMKDGNCIYIGEASPIEKGINDRFYYINLTKSNLTIDNLYRYAHLEKYDNKYFIITYKPYKVISFLDI